MERDEGTLGILRDQLHIVRESLSTLRGRNERTGRGDRSVRLAHSYAVPSWGRCSTGIRCSTFPDHSVFHATQKPSEHFLPTKRFPRVPNKLSSSPSTP